MKPSIGKFGRPQRPAACRQSPDTGPKYAVAGTTGRSASPDLHLLTWGRFSILNTAQSMPIRVCHGLSLDPLMDGQTTTARGNGLPCLSLHLPTGPPTHPGISCWRRHSQCFHRRCIASGRIFDFSLSGLRKQLTHLLTGYLLLVAVATASWAWPDSPIRSCNWERASCRAATAAAVDFGCCNFK